MSFIKKNYKLNKKAKYLLLYFISFHLVGFENCLADDVASKVLGQTLLIAEKLPTSKKVRHSSTSSLSSVTSSNDESIEEGSDNEEVINDKNSSSRSLILKIIKDAIKAKKEDNSSNDSNNENSFDQDLKALSQNILREINKKKRSELKIVKRSFRELSQMQTSFKNDNPGFEKVADSFLAVATQSQVPTEYHSGKAPLKLGISAPPSTGKTTFIKRWRDLMPNVPEENFHYHEISEDQVEIPFSKIRNSGINIGESSYPQIYFFDEWFRFPSFKKLKSDQERELRIKSIEDMHVLLGNGEEVVEYKFNPNDKFNTILENVQNIRELKNNISVNQNQVNELKEKISTLQKKTQQQSKQSSSVSKTKEEGNKISNDQIRSVARLLGPEYTTFYNALAAYQGPSSKDKVFFTKEIGDNTFKIKVSVDPKGSSPVVGEYDFTSFLNEIYFNSKNKPDKYFDKIDMTNFNQYVEQLLLYPDNESAEEIMNIIIKLNSEFNKFAKSINSNSSLGNNQWNTVYNEYKENKDKYKLEKESQPNLNYLEAKLTQKERSITPLIKEKKEKEEAFSIEIDEVKKSLPQMLGEFTTYSSDILLNAFYIDPTKTLTYLAEQLVHLPLSGTTKIFPHVKIIYAGVPPIFYEINKEFKKLDKKNQNYAEFLKIAEKLYPNSEDYLEKWIKEFYPAIKMDDIQRLGLNESFKSIPLFTSAVWEKIIENEAKAIFKTYLDATSVPVEIKKVITLKYDKTLLEKITNETIQPNMGRRNLRQLIREHLNTIFLQTSLYLHKNFKVDDPKENFPSSLVIDTHFDVKKQELKAMLSVVDGSNRGELNIATSSIRDSAKDENEDESEELPDETKKSLEDAVFLDVMSRLMASNPKNVLPHKPFTISELPKYWDVEQVDLCKNFRNLMVATVAKKLALKILFPDKIFGTNDEIEDAQKDKILDSSLRKIREELHQIVKDQFYNKVGSSPIPRDPLLFSLYKITNDDIKNKSKDYKKVIKVIEQYAVLHVLSNKPFIFALQNEIEGKKLQTAHQIHHFYKGNFPNHTEFSLVKFFKDHYNYKIDPSSDFDYRSEWKGLWSNLTKSKLGNVNSGLDQDIKRSISTPWTLPEKVLNSLKAIGNSCKRPSERETIHPFKVVLTPENEESRKRKYKVKKGKTSRDDDDSDAEYSNSSESEASAGMDVDSEEDLKSESEGESESEQKKSKKKRKLI